MLSKLDQFNECLFICSRPSLAPNPRTVKINSILVLSVSSSTLDLNGDFTIRPNGWIHISTIEGVVRLVKYALFRQNLSRLDGPSIIYLFWTGVS